MHSYAMIIGAPGEKGTLGDKGLVGEETYGKLNHLFPLTHCIVSI
jgi:hypothetical protein